MNIDTQTARACTTGSICNLSNCSDPVKAMQMFCKLTLVVNSAFNLGKYSILQSFYVFTAGPEVLNAYGTKFAQFIRDNKLGEVTTLPAKLNLKYHPTTTCQTWLWSPDQKAIEQWWESHKIEIPSNRPQSVTGTAVCPRCGQMYSVHNGWTCRDGGMWPE